MTEGERAQARAARALQAAALGLGVAGMFWHGLASLIAGGAVAWFLGIGLPPPAPPPK